MWFSTMITLAVAGAGVGEIQPQDTIRASDIAAGGRNTCAISPAGKTYCWGANNQGQIGIGTRTTEPRPFPTPVAAKAFFREVAIGGQFACGVTNEGDAGCWGYNRDGQLGNGTTDRGLEISLVLASVPIEQIATGEEHACALDPTGAAWCWGKNNNGQIGDGQPLSRGSYHATPVAVAGDLKFQQILAIGEDMSCGLTQSGQAYCWGLVDLMEWKASPTTSPIVASGDMVFETLAGGGDHICGLNNGRAYCWGENRSGQLGDSSNTRRPEPTAVRSDSTFVDLATGYTFSCALTVAGQGWCWGSNQSGQLGTGEGSYDNQGWNVPKPVFGEVRFREIVAGSQHVCGLATDATVYCWGDNNVGQLGTGTLGWRNIPTVVVAGP